MAAVRHAKDFEIFLSDNPSGSHDHDTELAKEVFHKKVEAWVEARANKTAAYRNKGKGKLRKVINPSRFWYVVRRRTVAILILICFVTLIIVVPLLSATSKGE
jgi:hypothetical protein